MAFGQAIRLVGSRPSAPSAIAQMPVPPPMSTSVGPVHTRAQSRAASIRTGSRPSCGRTSAP